MADADGLTKRALRQVADCNDPAELRRTAENAKRLGNVEVREAAQRRIYAISPDAHPGTLEHEVWQTVFALEGALSEERGKKTLMTRTRRKIKNDGELRAVADLVLKSASTGYQMLIDRGWAELTFEAVSLRYPDRFEPEVLAAARSRLNGSGVTVNLS